MFDFTGYSVSLPWSTRMKIAVGAAKGLAFLHEAEKPVIYRDFKASNILLDSVSIRLLGINNRGLIMPLYLVLINSTLYLFFPGLHSQTLRFWSSKRWSRRRRHARFHTGYGNTGLRCSRIHNDRYIVLDIN